MVKLSLNGHSFADEVSPIVRQMVPVAKPVESLRMDLGVFRKRSATVQRIMYILYGSKNASQGKNVCEIKFAMEASIAHVICIMQRMLVAYHNMVSGRSHLRKTPCRLCGLAVVQW